MPAQKNSSIRPLHIDYFNDFPLTLVGAESIHVYEICNQLEELGSKVRLFSPSPPKTINTKFALIHVWTPPFLKSVFYQIFVMPKIFSKWLTNKPDAIYIRVTPILIVPVLIAKLYRIPVFAEINGTIHTELQKANTRLGKILLLFRISDTVEKTIYRNAARIITVTHSLKEYLVTEFHVHESKVAVIENGVDADMLRPTTVKHTDKFVIGYVGGLMWWQGLDYIIDAVKLAADAVPNIELAIYGDGPEKIKLQEQVSNSGIENKVKFPGRVTHAEVPDIINSFDIGVAYYVKARAGLNSPFKVYEYLACGKPVIVSDTAGIGDVFADVADVVESENSNALAAAIVELCGNPKRRNAMGIRARKYIVNGHTWQNSATELLAIINEAL